jgi:hypothetical protein
MESNSKNHFTQFFQSEDVKKYIKETIHEIGIIIYNEMYLYVWFICLYHVFLIFLVLANLFILLKFLTEKNKNY